MAENKMSDPAAAYRALSREPAAEAVQEEDHKGVGDQAAAAHNREKNLDQKAEQLLASYADAGAHSHTTDPNRDASYRGPGFEDWKSAYRRAEDNDDEVRAARFAQDGLRWAVDQSQRLAATANPEGRAAGYYATLAPPEREQLAGAIADRTTAAGTGDAADGRAAGDDRHAQEITSDLKQARPADWKQVSETAMLQHQDRVEVIHYLVQDAVSHERKGDVADLLHAMERTQQDFESRWQQGLPDVQAADRRPAAYNPAQPAGEQVDQRLEYLARTTAGIGLDHRPDLQAQAVGYLTNVTVNRDLRAMADLNHSELTTGNAHRYSGLAGGMHNDMGDAYRSAGVEIRDRLSRHDKEGAAAAYHAIDAEARAVRDLDHLAKHPESETGRRLEQDVAAATQTLADIRPDDTETAARWSTQVHAALEQGEGPMARRLETYGRQRLEEGGQHLAQYQEKGQNPEEWGMALRHKIAALECYHQAATMAALNTGDYLQEHGRRRIEEEQLWAEAVAYSSGETGAISERAIIFAYKDPEVEHQPTWEDQRERATAQGDEHLWRATWERRDPATADTTTALESRATAYALGLSDGHRRTLMQARIDLDGQDSGYARERSIEELLMHGSAAQAPAQEAYAGQWQRGTAEYHDARRQVDDVTDDLLALAEWNAAQALLQDNEARLAQARAAMDHAREEHHKALSDPRDSDHHAALDLSPATRLEEIGAVAPRRLQRHHQLMERFAEENPGLDDIDYVEAGRLLADRMGAREAHAAREAAEQVADQSRGKEHHQTCAAAAASLFDDQRVESLTAEYADSTWHNLVDQIAREAGFVNSDLEGLGRVSQLLNGAGAADSNATLAAADKGAAYAAAYADPATRDAVQGQALALLDDELAARAEGTAVDRAFAQQGHHHLQLAADFTMLHGAGHQPPPREPSHRASAQFHLEQAAAVAAALRQSERQQRDGP